MRRLFRRKQKPEGKDCNDDKTTSSSNNASASNIYKVVVAIDLGTTYSGYAFAYWNEKSKIYMNKNWGAGQSCLTFKTPTSVLTGPSDEFVDFGYDASATYSQHLADEKEGYNLYQHFKMILHKTGNLDESTMIKSVTGKETRAINIFVFMLKALKDHCLETIAQSSKGEPQPNSIRWVVTVPAIWTDTAKDFMREAALQAGLITSKESEQLVLALEPEAAAFFCKQIPVNIFGRERETSISLKAGQRYLVIDAGGGTIDITAHEVVEDLKVRELIVANGGDWGGTAVDREFRGLLVKIFGETFITEYERKGLFELMNDFDKVKRSLNGKDQDRILIDLKYNLVTAYQEMYGHKIEKIIKEKACFNVDFRNGKLIIQKASLLFDSTVSKITEHVMKILKDSALQGLPYVMLVGGFGESPILQQAIQNILPTGCELIVPQEAQLSVIKGAVYFGFHLDEVTSRIVKKTYGSQVCEPFIAAKHDKRHKIFSDKGTYCDNIFSPFIIKGNAVRYGETITEVRSPFNDMQTVIQFQIYSTDLDDFDNIHYVDEPDMFHLGSVTIDLPEGMKSDRSVRLEFWFGGTEIRVTATNANGKKAETFISYSTKN